MTLAAHPTDRAAPAGAVRRHARPRDAARTLSVLAGLAATLPVDLAITAGALARRAPRPTTRTADTRRTVLVSGGKMTKALHLARAFHLAGHRVVLAESAKYRLTGHRFSRAVDAFHCTPEPTDPRYPQALADIIIGEGVDVFVPVSSPAASVPEAAVQELVGDRCQVLHGSAALIATLDDKRDFSTLCASLGLSVPESQLITDASEVSRFDYVPGRSYVLKRLAYNPIGRTDLTRLRRETPDLNTEFARSLDISPSDPWLLQEYVEGQEYCTHSTLRDGVVTVYGCCESSAVQLNYRYVEKPQIRSWVEHFAASTGVSGQISFDFIEGPDGRPYAIECNPRTHSAITMFHDHPDVAHAYLTDGHPTITPLPGSTPTYWIYHELWRLLRGPDRLRRLRVIARGRDAIFAAWDPLPYLCVYHLQIPALLVSNLRQRRGWSRIDFNIGKLVENGGD
ncbi:MAG: ATP-grasp enzyme [Mycobacterium kyogaense]|uniref:ATP-grasp enzyme n=1 Tax=Mycobacterium kyogaense TaxID=2212479 RepID=UPI002FFC156D